MLITPILLLLFTIVACKSTRTTQSECKTFTNGTVPLVNMTYFTDYFANYVNFKTANTTNNNDTTILSQCLNFQNNTCYGVSQIIGTAFHIAIIMGQDSVVYNEQNGSTPDNNFEAALSRTVRAMNIYPGEIAKNGKYSQFMINSTVDGKILSQYIVFPLKVGKSQMDLFIPSDKNGEYDDNKVENFALTYLQFNTDHFIIGLRTVKEGCSDNSGNTGLLLSIYLRHEYNNDNSTIKAPNSATNRWATWLSEQIARDLNKRIMKYPNISSIYGTFALEDSLIFEFGIHAVAGGLTFTDFPTRCHMLTQSLFASDNKENTTQTIDFQKTAAAAAAATASSSSSSSSTRSRRVRPPTASTTNLNLFTILVSTISFASFILICIL